MDRVKLAPGLALSRIVYGTWRLTDDDTAPARIRAKLDACLAAGITTLDQADIYGGYTAEAALGAAFAEAPGLRDRFEIVTKCGIVLPEGRHAGARLHHYDTSRAHIEASVEASRAAMGVDRIDLLLIHRPDPFMDAHETGAALDGLVAAGKVAHVGVSNFAPHDMALLQSAMETPLVTNQIEISLLRSDPFRNGEIAHLQARGMPPMAWSPLAGGRLFAPEHAALHGKLAAMGEAQGVDAGSVAVAWLMAHPARILPVLGTNDPARIARLGRACDVTLTREDWFDLYTTALGTALP